MTAAAGPDRTGGDDDARLLLDKANHWYWAEREVCGFATDTEPPCVKSSGHDGDCDGTYAASARERLTAFLDHEIATGGSRG